MDQFLSALLGGLLALFGTWLTGLIQKKQKDDSDKKEEYGLVTSIKCEFLALENLIIVRHKDILEGNFGEEGYFRFEHSSSGNYLAFFDGNMGNMMKIEREDVRLQIQQAILYGRSYIDSLQSHAQLLYKIENLEFQCNRNPEDELCKAYLEGYTQAIIEYDQDLHFQAKDLIQMIQKLKVELSTY